MKKRSFYKPNLQKWTEEQYALFRNALSENAGVFFDLLRMGIRKNEALALTPSDISPIGISINMNAIFTFNNYSNEIPTIKTIFLKVVNIIRA